MCGSDNDDIKIPVPPPAPQANAPLAVPFAGISKRRSPESERHPRGIRPLRIPLNPVVDQFGTGGSGLQIPLG